MKRHVNYVIKECKIFSLSNNAVFKEATKKKTIRAINNMFVITKLHEDYLIQNKLFRNIDDKKGKRLTQRKYLRPLKSRKGNKTALNSKEHKDETKVDDLPNELVIAAPAKDLALNYYTTPKSQLL